MTAESTPLLLGIGVLLVGGVLATRAAERARLPPLTAQLGAGAILAWLAADWVGAAEGAITAARDGAGAVLLFWIGVKGFRRARERTASVVAPTLAGVALAVPACALALALGPGALGSELGAPRIILVALVLSLASPTIVGLVGQGASADASLARAALDAALLGNGVLVAAVIAALTFAAAAGAADLRILADLSAGLAVGGLAGVVFGWAPRSLPPAMRALTAVAGFAVLRVASAHVEAAIAAGALAAGAALGGAAEPRAGRAEERLDAAVPAAGMILFVGAGATVDLDRIAGAALPALVIVLVRAGALFAGWRAAARGEPSLRRLASAPLLPQAGFSIALLGAIEPVAGASAGALVLAVVALNELVMPPLVRLALRVDPGDRGATSDRLQAA